MENQQRDDPWGRDWPQQYSALPNIGISKLLSQQQLPVPSTSVPQGRMSPPPRSKNTIIQTIAIKNPIRQPSRSHECVQRFRDFHSRTGSFRSSAGSKQVLSTRISMRDFIEFQELLHNDKEEERFPYYSYNAWSSLLTTKHLPSPMHEKILPIISDGFGLTLRRLPPSIRRRIAIVRNQGFAAFQGKYNGSQKAPDLALQVTNDAGGREVKFVVEVGLSESYEELISDAKMWLEGTRTVSLVMLIKFEETPRYECPTKNLTDRQLAELRFPQPIEIMNEPFTLTGPYGPAVYKGLVWMGKVSGFFEFWGRNSLSGLATCVTSRMKICDMKNNPDSGLWLSELIDIGPEHDEEIQFDWDCFLCEMEGHIRETAENRCCIMLNNAGKRAGELDSDYQLEPSSQASSD